ncbi:UNVERIFIED_CONTAM: Rhomboid-like protein 19 [Sesamum angustifolium]|uniref:Rhomboid-like protein 19 n=1 Tax=Sesamum angustifolium TaxID=2727405 RepID=A0AAW2PSH0_9LAMI
MSSPQLSGGGVSIYTGFTRLCKGLAVVLIGGHVVVQIFPSAVSYLALIPAKTIPFAWNLITAGYVEQSIHGVFISTIGLLFIGKLLEPIWGSREFLKFIFVVNFLTSVCVFITAISLYYITRQESYLILSRHQTDNTRSRAIFIEDKSKMVAFSCIIGVCCCKLFTTDSASYLPTLIFGTYIGWIYLRYWQRKPETKVRGDPSDEFAFSTFFPEVFRPVIDPLATIFERLLCGRRSEASDEPRGYTLGVASLPGSDPVEASRRRERGARALEERLAAERLAAAAGGGRTQDSQRDAAENV